MNIVDLLLFILIAVIAVISAHKGFLMAIFNIISYVASGILAKLFSSPITSYIYSEYAYDKVMAKLNELIPTGSLEGELYDVIEGVFASFPAFLVELADHFDIFDNLSLYNNSASTDKVFTVELIEAEYLGPVIQSIISVIVIVLLFIFFAIILKLVLGVINKLLTSKKHKLMRKTNMFLGAALGVVKGVIPAGAICAILNIAVPVMGNPSLTEFVEGSYFCNLVADILK